MLYYRIEWKSIDMCAYIDNWCQYSDKYRDTNIGLQTSNKAAYIIEFEIHIQDLRAGSSYFEG